MLHRTIALLAVVAACLIASVGHAGTPSLAPPSGERSKWYLVAAGEEDSRPQHRGQYEFWIKDGALAGVMLLHRSGTRPLFDLEFDRETLSFRQVPEGPRLVLRGAGDKFAGIWEPGPQAALVLVRAWD